MRPMRFSPRWLVTLPAAWFAAGLLGGAAADPVRTALADIKPGEWRLRALDDSMPARTVCVSDPEMLIQLRHPHASCTRFVIESEPGLATVHYTCPRAGYGRTTIKVETSGLIRIDSQGIAANAPFETALEGRRIGECTPQQARR